MPPRGAVPWIAERAHRASRAQWHADRAARRPRLSKLAANPALRDYVEARLVGMITDVQGVAFGGPDVLWKGRRAIYRQSRRWSTAWSPEQIAHHLQHDYPEDATMRISHEAIYQSLYIQGRGVLRRELSACLRSDRALRVPRERSRHRGRSFINETILISQGQLRLKIGPSLNIGSGILSSALAAPQ